jgi:DNA-binding transcriptional ArsR family regulator
MEGRIVLDDKSFKALSADSRINIMKSLNDRRRTLSELSQKLELGNSTIKEHCDILVDAELIKQIDEGRKWKYYELTSKGKQIISPSLMEEVKVLIVLCFGVFAIGGIIMMLSLGLSPANFNSLQNESSIDSTFKTTASPMMAKSLMEDTVIGAGNQTAMTAETLIKTNEITQEFYAISILLSLVMGIVIGWIFLRKR